MKLSEMAIGQRFQTEKVKVSKEEIFQFAEKYDPQYLHIDEKAAEEGPFGQIIASGFHTIAIIWREWVQMDILGRDCLGGIRAEKMEWKKPVTAGDELYGIFTVADIQLGTRNRGILTMDLSILNGDQTEVCTSKFVILMAQ